MNKRTLTIALAYTGVIVGAGLSSGQDLMQYFLCFGIWGLAGVVVLGLLNILFGKIILTLGSYYKSDSHEQVLLNIAPVWAAKLIDWTLVLSSFVMGFVMIAGAGSNLQQQFGLPAWLGALICTVLIILVSYLDFDKITGVLGVFTPIVIVMILITAFWSVTHAAGSIETLNSAAETIKPAIGNLWLSVLNYFALCVMTGVSMAFVLGGSITRIPQAFNGGRLGGVFIMIIVTAASIALFFNMPSIIDDEIPMLALVGNIDSWFALADALVIFALIFNTAFSLFYSAAKRLSGDHPEHIHKILIAMCLAGYVCSFGGFANLISWLYPILGYLGIFLLVILLYGWAREKKRIRRETHLRRKMIGLQIHRLDPGQEFDNDQAKAMIRLGEASAADTKTILKETAETAKEVLEEGSEMEMFEEELHMKLPPAE